MKKSYLLLTITFIMLLVDVYAQSYLKKENYVWLNRYHVRGYGLDFNGGSPPKGVFNSSQTTGGLGSGFSQGYASICDKNGTLLFYSDGNIVWDRNNDVMVNGWDINNDGALAPNTSYIAQLPMNTWPITWNSSMNSDGVAIIPVPGTSHKYYLFSVVHLWHGVPGEFIQVGRWEGKLRFSIVDMEHNNGLGAVDISRRGKIISDSMAGNLHGVVGENCNYWLVGMGSSGYYKAFNITSSGIDTLPVISVLSQVNYPFIFELNLSPNGKIAAQNFYDGAGYGEVQVSDFDPSNGRFSNAISLGSQQSYHTAFSPDNSKLYISGIVGLRQYETSNYSLPFTLLYFNSSVYEYANPIRLGPDGRIYFSTRIGNSKFGGHIQSPSLSGRACQIDTIPNPPPLFWADNSLQHQFPNEVPVLEYELKVTNKDVPLCFNQKNVYLFPDDTTGTEYRWRRAGYDSIWIRGDVFIPLEVSDPGKYTVEYYSTTPCAFHRDTFTVKRITYAYSLGENQISCNGLAVQLGMDIENARYLWQDGSTAPFLNVTKSGKYWVEINKDKCIISDTISVRVIDIQQELGNDTLLCSENDPQEILLNAKVMDGATVKWSTGGQTSSIQVSDSGWYSVEVKAGNCIGTDSIHISKKYCNCPILLPSAFSPNGDGRNDFFMPSIPSNCYISSYKLIIYNRWNQVVFTGYKSEEGWDGTYQGRPADTGTYMYSCQLEAGESKTNITKLGDLILVR